MRPWLRIGTAALALPVVAVAPACGGGEAGERAGEAGPAERGPDRPATARSAPAPGARCEELAALLGAPGSASGDLCRVTFPRRDLSVSLLGATLPAGMGLTSWAAFAPAGERGAIVMGDLALTAEELPPVQAALRERGLRVTAVHRHMVGERPGMSFMHYLGIGPSDSLAGALATALDAAPTARGASRGEASGAQGAAREATGAPAVGGEPGVVAGTSCDEIARTLGADAGSVARGPGYCKVSLPRSDLDVRVDGVAVPAALGIGSWFAFRRTDDGTAAVIAGDMALTEEQVNPAIGALRARGIDVVALHNHMILDRPRVMFFHFQARGSPSELAEGLAAGLEAAGLSGSADGAPGRAFP